MMYFTQSSDSAGGEGYSESMDDQEDLFRSKVQALWKEECFIDVTLACENKLLTAHKLVLGAYSDYFKEMFSSIQTNQYPIVFMKDVSFDILQAILEFMYCGEVNVAQYNLNSFMKTAHTLKIKGLSLAEDSVPVPNDQQQRQVPPQTQQQQQHAQKRRPGSLGDNLLASPPLKRKKMPIMQLGDEYQEDFDEEEEEEEEEMREALHLKRKQNRPSQPGLTLNENTSQRRRQSSFGNSSMSSHHSRASTTQSIGKNQKQLMRSKDSLSNATVHQLQESFSDVNMPYQEMLSDVGFSDFEDAADSNLQDEYQDEEPVFKMNKDVALRKKNLGAKSSSQRINDDMLPRTTKFKSPKKTVHSPKAVRGQFNPQQATLLSLGPKQEDLLVKFINFMSQITPLTVNQIRLFAWGIDSVLGGNKFGKDGPPKMWWNLFKRRHPDVCKVLRSYDFLKPSHLKSDFFSFRALSDYLIPVQEIIEAFDLNDKPENFFSCCEYTVNLKNPLDRCLYPSRERHVTSENFPVDGDFASVMLAGSASGKMMPPFVVFKESLPNEECSKEGPSSGMYAQNSSGFIDSDLMFKWFQHSFLPQCPKGRSEDNPVVLLLNSMFPLISPKMLDLALAENVIILTLMPHVHHSCQPMDVSFVKGLREVFKDNANKKEMKARSLRECLPSLLREFFERVLTSEMVSDGFRTCGIFPLSMNINQDEYLKLRSQLQFDDLVETNLKKGNQDIDVMLKHQNRKMKHLKNKNNEISTSDEEEELVEDSNSCYVCGKPFPSEGCVEDDGKWFKCAKRYCKNYSCDECLPINYDKSNEYVCIDCNH